MTSEETSTGRERSETSTTVLVALGANFLIALAKLGAGLLSGSSALLAEAAHSAADTVNQVFLLVSLSLGNRRPDESHPFGRGMERYFWALMAAILIFVGGAVFSVAKGVLVLENGATEDELTVAFVVLGVAFAADAVSLLRAVRQARRAARALGLSLAEHVRQSSDPTVKVVLAEDAAAVLGVVIAAAGVFLLHVTGNAAWDGAASIAIGLLLALVAYLIGRDAKIRLIGKAAAPRDRQAIADAVAGHPSVLALSELLTLQVGPEDILVAARLELEDGLSTNDVEHVMDELQRGVREAVGGVQQLFIDPTPSGAEGVRVSRPASG